MSDDPGEQSVPITPLSRLRTQILTGWHEFPSDRAAELDVYLKTALDNATKAVVEVLTVMNPVSRPLRLRLHVLVTDAGLDTWYHRERAELSVSRDGICYLIYRRDDGGHYGIEWSTATTLPTGMMAAMPDILALAMLEGDHDASR